MRIIAISDTHTLHTSKKLNKELMDLINPEEYNVLLHSGDLTGRGDENAVRDFVYWFQNLKGFDDKIFIAGNHDFGFQTKPDWLYQYINEENLSQSDCVYLEDSEFVITLPEFSRPIKFYGTPWQPWFYDWAFNLPRMGKELESKWNLIPDDTDVLITHGPPHQIRDHIRTETPGCELLRKRVFEINPFLHVFGHIHNAYGGMYLKNTLFINSSICNEEYKPVNSPYVISIREIDGEFITNVISPL